MVRKLLALREEANAENETQSVEAARRTNLPVIQQSDPAPLPDQDVARVAVGLRSEGGRGSVSDFAGPRERATFQPL